METTTRRKELGDLTRLFLKLGTIAFGGPAAHIALMEDDVVRRRRWLSHEEFLDLLGAVNLIPGPNSTEMAIFIGHRRAGWPGLAVAGISFILPSAILVTAIAWSYVRFGKLPQVQSLLYGVKPVIIALVVQALWGLGRAAVKTKWLATVGFAAASLNFAGVNELIVLFGCGFLIAAARAAKALATDIVPNLIPLTGGALGLSLATAVAPTMDTAVPFSLSVMFLFFLKVGAVLFGSGYVLLAFLRADLVERLHWLTESQLLDAVAVGQVTPGPVFTTATFIGYVLGGPAAAALATIGIFLPSFFFVAISGPLVLRLRRSPLAGAFLDGVNVASLALMGVVTWHFGVSTLQSPLAVLLAAVSAVLLLKNRVNSSWLVLGGALVGLLIVR